jgi:hypothetical protein
MRHAHTVSLIVILGASILGVDLLSTPAAARLAPYDGIGGSGGVPFRLDCGPSAVLIGIRGQSGVVIDQIAGLCVKIDPISGVWVGGAYETAHYGGNGGSPFNKRCPVGQALWGLEGSVNYFNGTPVVGSIDIKCVDIGLRGQGTNASIEGTKLIDYYGDPDPLKIQALQDYCDRPQTGTNLKRESRVWSGIGVALEGRSGVFVDRIHIVCGFLPADTQGYRVQFKPGSNILVPEGTSLQISWRASGVSPELTPGLQYRWTLTDLTHTEYSGVSIPGGGSIGMSTPELVRNPCAFAAPPCTSGWFDSASSSSVTFFTLPPATYELTLSVSPSTTSQGETKRRLSFQISPNLLVSLKLSRDSLRAGSTATGTVAMEGPAPPKGRVLYLYSSNSDLVPVPRSFTVPGGSTVGTFTVRSISAPGSAGQVTITVSTKPPVLVAKTEASAHVSVLSRGVDEGTPPDAALESPESQPEDSAVATPPQETPDTGAAEEPSQEEVTERGISTLQMARPSTSIQSAIATAPPRPSPIVTLPPPETSAAVQTKPSSPVGPAAVGKLNFPSDTKSAVLTVELPIGIQRQGK